MHLALIPRIYPDPSFNAWSAEDVAFGSVPVRAAAPTRSCLQGRNFLDRALKVDLLQYNTPRWVHMGDRISMANSIVSRSPFLDYRLVEFAFSLDNNLKIRNAETKYVLREAKRNVLPASIVNDHKKVQFDGPATQWLKGSLKNFVLSLRDGKDAKLSGLLRADLCAISSMISSALSAPIPPACGAS